MKKLIAFVLVLMMAFSLVACGNTAPVADDATDKDYVAANGKLVVGITDFEPMDYLDANGEWIGFDADLAKAFAEELGVAVEFVEIDWDNKIMELNNKSIDCIWNGMTRTAEVAAAMNCGKTYCNNSQVLVLNSDVASNYATVEDCAALSVAVEAGSAGESVATDAGLTCTPVSTQADALMEVAAGTSDACVIDVLMAKAMTGEGTSYPNLTATIILCDEEYVVGFRTGSDLADLFNTFYDAAYADGTVMALAEKYGIAGSIVA